MTPEYNQNIANIIGAAASKPVAVAAGQVGPGVPGGTTPAPTAPLPLEKKEHWNNFIDFMEKSGYKGNVALDNRDTNLGKILLDKYNQANPSSTLTYNDVSQVQSELQAYRQQLLNKYKSGQAVPDASMKNPETDLMPGLSKVDGWLGSKTSSYKFPGASVTHTDGTKQNFGLNTAAYDQYFQSAKKH